MLDLPRNARLVLFALLFLIVADAPFRTFGQRYEVSRARARFVLLAFELGLGVLWAAAVFRLRWDRWLLPRGFETGLAWPGLLVVSFFIHTVYEEALFERHFGAACSGHRRRVPRLVPFARWGKRDAWRDRP